MFWRANNPNESNAPCGDCAGYVACSQVAHKGDLVRDAYAAGEEHHCAVGMEDLAAAIGPFDESGEGDARIV